MTKLIVLIGFGLMFAAGLVTANRVLPGHPHGEPGMLPPPSTMPMNFGPRGFLFRELNLSEDQRTKLNQIWSSVAYGRPGQQDDRRRQMRKERDDAIYALIPAEKQPDYQKIVDQYSKQQSAMEQETHAAFDSAVEQTRSILTDDQRTKYDEIRKQMQANHNGPHGDGPHGGDFGPSTRSGAPEH